MGVIDAIKAQSVTISGMSAPSPYDVKSAGVGAAPASVPIEPGEVSATADVTIVFGF